jgi:hypothetical protein
VEEEWLKAESEIVYCIAGKDRAIGRSEDGNDQAAGYGALD